MQKGKIIGFLKRNPGTSKEELYEAFPKVSHSTLGRFYSDFTFIKKSYQTIKGKILTKLKEEKERIPKYEVELRELCALFILIEDRKDIVSYFCRISTGGESTLRSKTSAVIPINPIRNKEWHIRKVKQILNELFAKRMGVKL